jgi:ParB-like chromosome segregation protein Spo0J
MEGSLQNVALTELPDTIGAPPSARLIESVERHGIIQPVMLAEDTDESGEIHLVIIDGNRRVAASRQAGLTYVPAFVLSGLSAEEIAQWTLVANGFRTSNYLTEFGAIRLLEGTNYSPNDIRKISGMASTSIDLRNQLSGLNRELFAALQHGSIGQAEAIAAAKLHREDQELLAQRFRERGKLTRADIREIAPQDDSSDEQPPQPSLHDDLRSAIQAAKDLDLSKDQFLTLASKLWDTDD